MPRKPPQPGPRQNRSDLPAQGQSAQPVRVASGRPYGERARTVQAQQDIPLPEQTTDQMAAAAGRGGAGGPPPAGPTTNPFEDFVTAAREAPSPGQGLLTAPSARPGEPLTAGLSTGPGAGPEALPPSLATQGPDPALILWSRWLPALGILASQPGSSPQVRQYYRRLRSQLPPDYFAQTEQT